MGNGQDKIQRSAALTLTLAWNEQTDVTLQDPPEETKQHQSEA